MPTYARLPLIPERGQGSWLWDREGNSYLDAITGIGVCALGHAHPRITEALHHQAQRLIHTSNLYRIDRQEHLADRLVALSDMENVFFGNSGAEANEAALKIARLYGHQRGIDTPVVVVMENSFHGRTLATLSATGNPKVRQGFEPLVSGFLRLPFDDLTALEEAAEAHPDIVAVLVEPIQGEGGIRVPAPDYLPRLRALCDQHQWLLILDEIQTGMGKTGRWFACQHHAIRPDLLTVAKALGNGIPIGACLAAGPAARVFQTGQHGSTFGGNPLACHVAATVIDVIEQERLLARAEQLGRQLREALRQALDDSGMVKQVRGQGLMIGVELQRACGELTTIAARHGLLINVTAGNVIRLLPPLNLSDEEARILVERLTAAVTEFARNASPVTTR